MVNLCRAYVSNGGGSALRSRLPVSNGCYTALSTNRTRVQSMIGLGIGAAGLASVAAGAIVACVSARFPSYVERLETGAGLLLIAGFAISACALPAMI